MFNARARDLAEELARRTALTVSEIVERALDAYARGKRRARAGRGGLADRGEDIDFALIQYHRLPHWGVDL
jgi:hypothetical protein